MLILAGVSIATLTGDNGILTKATKAKEETKIATDEEQRKLAIAEAAMNFENTEYQGVTIPAGFAPTRIEGESTVDNGLVIIDSEGNEFVWIPIENGFAGEEEELSETVGWEKQEYKEMKSSVSKYKGFYIGRYEAGSVEERKGVPDSAVGTTKMVIKRDQYPYNFVCWGIYNAEDHDYSKEFVVNNKELGSLDFGKGAVYLSRHMYDGKEVGVKSTLCYRCQWDALIEFIKDKSVVDVDSSTNWGNYYETKFEIRRKGVRALRVTQGEQLHVFEGGMITVNGKFPPTDDGYVLTTGATDRNKACNVYDVAGNCWEMLMTSGANLNGRDTRFRAGGTCSAKGDVLGVTSKTNIYVDAGYSEVSFRPALFIKL